MSVNLNSNLVEGAKSAAINIAADVVVKGFTNLISKIGNPDEDAAQSTVLSEAVGLMTSANSFLAVGGVDSSFANVTLSQLSGTKKGELREKCDAAIKLVEAGRKAQQDILASGGDLEYASTGNFNLYKNLVKAGALAKGINLGTEGQSTIDGYKQFLGWLKSVPANPNYNMPQTMPRETMSTVYNARVDGTKLPTKLSDNTGYYCSPYLTDVQISELSTEWSMIPNSGSITASFNQSVIKLSDDSKAADNGAGSLNMLHWSNTPLRDMNPPKIYYSGNLNFTTAAGGVELYKGPQSYHLFPQIVGGSSAVSIDDYVIYEGMIFPTVGTTDRTQSFVNATVDHQHNGNGTENFTQSTDDYNTFTARVLILDVSSPTNLGPGRSVTGTIISSKVCSVEHVPSLTPSCLSQDTDNVLATGTNNNNPMFFQGEDSGDGSAMWDERTYDGSTLNMLTVANPSMNQQGTLDNSSVPSSGNAVSYYNLKQSWRVRITETITSVPVGHQICVVVIPDPTSRGYGSFYSFKNGINSLYPTYNPLRATTQVTDTTSAQVVATYVDIGDETMTKKKEKAKPFAYYLDPANGKKLIYDGVATAETSQNYNDIPMASALASAMNNVFPGDLARIASAVENSQSEVPLPTTAAEWFDAEITEEQMERLTAAVNSIK